MAVTDVSICSNALLLLGHNPISSFTEGGAGAQVSANMYETVYESVLTMHRWRFAAGQVALSRLVDTPLHDWAYAYQLPADYLVAIKVYPHADYEIFEDKIYCDQASLAIDYLFKPEENTLPPYFLELMEFRLASKFAIPVTGNRSLADTYFAMFQDQFNRASSLDSQARPSDPIQDSPFIDARQ